MENTLQLNSVLDDSRLELTSDIVAAYVSNNPVPASELPNLISNIWSSITKLAGSPNLEPVGKSLPAVPIKKSITKEYIICLEDGKKYKSMKRALMSRYGMTPDEYRAKWDLPADYPMTAPSYTEKRSQLAKEAGLGKQPKAKGTRRRGKAR